VNPGVRFLPLAFCGLSRVSWPGAGVRCRDGRLVMRTGLGVQASAAGEPQPRQGGISQFLLRMQGLGSAGDVGAAVTRLVLAC